MDARARIEQLRTRRRGISPREIDALLRSAGFSRRVGRGDHWVYSHPARRGPLTIDSGRNPLLPAYVTKAINAVEEVLDDGDA